MAQPIRPKPHCPHGLLQAGAEAWVPTSGIPQAQGRFESISMLPTGGFGGLLFNGNFYRTTDGGR